MDMPFFNLLEQRHFIWGDFMANLQIWRPIVLYGQLVMHRGNLANFAGTVTQGVKPLRQFSAKSPAPFSTNSVFSGLFSGSSDVNKNVLSHYSQGPLRVPVVL